MHKFELMLLKCQYILQLFYTQHRSFTPFLVFIAAVHKVQLRIGSHFFEISESFKKVTVDLFFIELVIRNHKCDFRLPYSYYN